MRIIRQYEADDYVISEYIMRGTHKFVRLESMMV